MSSALSTPMNDLTLICQVFYKNSVLHSGLYQLNSAPEFIGEFSLPSEASTGPIDCRLTVMDRDNSLVYFNCFMAPASGSLITRMLNINILRMMKEVYNSRS